MGVVVTLKSKMAASSTRDSEQFYLTYRIYSNKRRGAY